MRRERTYRSEGIILKRSDFGEADRLLTLYTREYGKLRALAKGARKPQSRKTGHVELFMRSSFMIASARTFDIITQAELVDPYRNLSQDLMRMTYASYVVELLDSFTPEDERHPGLYQLIMSALEWFNTTDNFQLAARFYELRLLSLTGFQPQLFYCVASGEPIEQESQYFSHEEGGLIRPQHRASDRRARRISAAAVKVLRYLQTRDWETVQNLQLRNELQRELEMLMHSYIQYHLEKGLRSADFLQRLRRESAVYTQLDP